MPQAKVELPNGQVATLEVPAGMSNSEIQNAVQQMYDEGRIGQKEYGVGEGIVGGLEAMGSVASGLLAEPVAGLTGLAQMGFGGGGAEAGAEAIQRTREALTYQPRTPAGRTGLRNIGEAVAPIIDPWVQFAEGLGEKTLEATGSPELATAARTAPDALLALTGLKGLQSARGGVRLLDEAGNPTIDLRRVLEQQGLTYEALTPEARAAIPETLPANVVPGGERSRLGSEITKEELTAGGKQAGLAPLTLQERTFGGERVVKDPYAQEVIKQGMDPGYVQAIKMANPETKSKMSQMLGVMRSVKANRAQAMRPSDVSGSVVVDRLRMLDQSVSDATKQLNQIAEKSFKGQRIDTTPVNNKLNEIFDNYGIRPTYEPGSSKPILDKSAFRDSDLRMDPSAQRNLKQVIEVMSEGGVPDAYRLHQLKRMIDGQINWGRTPRGSISDATQTILRDIRGSLNNTLREANPRYAEVNDRISQSLNLFDDFQSAIGQKIDIFGRTTQTEGAGVGQNLRRLFGNTVGRAGLEDALNRLDTLYKQAGGTGKESVYELAMFANALDDQFGAVAKTSFRGDIEAAVKQGQQAQRTVQQGPAATAWQAGAEKVGEAVQKMRGINEENAFNAIEELLRRRY
jgi:hypothetical protein